MAAGAGAQFSLYHWDGLGQATWAGFSNYTATWSDPSLRGAFGHLLVLILFYSVLPCCIAFVLVAAMSRTKIRGLTFFRTVLFLPQVVAMVAVAVAWQWVYSADGPVNTVLGWLHALGLPDWRHGWFGDFTFALPAVGAVGTWVGIGLAMVLFLAGVQKIPRELYEAARIDGAGPFREFFAVTLPGLRRELAVALTLTTIMAIRNFDLIYMATAAGRATRRRSPPTRSTTARSTPVRSASAARSASRWRCWRSPSRRRPAARGREGRMNVRAERFVNHAILVLFSVIAVFPMIGIVAQAFQLPHVDLSTFGTAWREGHFATYLRNSVIVTTVTVVTSAVLSIMAGYALGTMRFRGSGALFLLFVAGLTIPTEAIVVPLYFDLRSAGLDNSYAGLILPQVAMSVAFGTFWMRAYFRSIPRSLLEAARIDGASGWTTLWRVLVPVGRPAILTMVLLTTMWTWNEFLLPLVIVNSDEGLRTAPLGLSFFQGTHKTDYSLLMAGALIIAAPIVIVYVFLQRQFIAGMLSGAVKE
ncbi:ABC transporter permease subunit [Actinomadura luteofluorescens]